MHSIGGCDGLAHARWMRVVDWIAVALGVLSI